MIKEGKTTIRQCLCDAYALCVFVVVVVVNKYWTVRNALSEIISIEDIEVLQFDSILLKFAMVLDDSGYLFTCFFHQIYIYYVYLIKLCHEH